MRYVAISEMPSEMSEEIARAGPVFWNRGPNRPDRKSGKRTAAMARKRTNPIRRAFPWEKSAEPISEGIDGAGPPDGTLPAADVVPAVAGDDGCTVAACVAGIVWALPDPDSAVRV
jgi:hypothetical protein